MNEPLDDVFADIHLKTMLDRTRTGFNRESWAQAALL